MTVPEIKAELKKRGLKVGGTKQVLVGRLVEAITEVQQAEEEGKGPSAADDRKRSILEQQRASLEARSKQAEAGPGAIPSGDAPPPRPAGILDAFDAALDEWYGSEDGELGRVRKIGRQGECPGCGCRLQSKDDMRPGYVPASKIGSGDAVCARCYGLQHYGKVEEVLTAQRAVHDEVSPEHFRKVLAPIRKKECIICYVCDVFDFHGTFLPDLTELVGSNPVVLAVNKADLLPKNYNQERVKRWVRTSANSLGSPKVVDVVMVSAKTGFGVDILENQLRSWSSKRRQDVYILGAANVGKSTLVNRIMSRGKAAEQIVQEKGERMRGLRLATAEDLREAELGNMQWIESEPTLQEMASQAEGLDELDDDDDEEMPEGMMDAWAAAARKQMEEGPNADKSSQRELDAIGDRMAAEQGLMDTAKAVKELARLERKDVKEWERNMLKGKEGGVTTSALPGTTLGLTELDLGNEHSLYDTPGLIVPMQLTNRLLMTELSAVLPQRRIEHVTYRVPEGSCVHLGGLCRLDNVGGKPFFFTVFVGNEVTIHVGKIEKAEDFRRKHVGGLIKPPFTEERLDEIGPLSKTELWAEGITFERSCVDVIFAGLGWVSLTGIGRVDINAWAPEGVGVMTRLPLMPFEALSTTESFTGAEKKGSTRRSKKNKGSLKQRVRKFR